MPQVFLSLVNPRFVLLRRFVNNISFAAGMLQQELAAFARCKAAAACSATASDSAAAESGTAAPVTAGGSAAEPSEGTAQALLTRGADRADHRQPHYGNAAAGPTAADAVVATAAAAAAAATALQAAAGTVTSAAAEIQPAAPLSRTDPPPQPHSSAAVAPTPFAEAAASAPGHLPGTGQQPTPGQPPCVSFAQRAPSAPADLAAAPQASRASADASVVVMLEVTNLQVRRCSAAGQCS